MERVELHPIRFPSKVFIHEAYLSKKANILKWWWMMEPAIEVK
ncbi:MAG: hypothetical protein ACOC5S_05380 [Acidobacteriota bacterium]